VAARQGQELQAAEVLRELVQVVVEAVAERQARLDQA
jgi:hypothetical protein